MQIIKEIILAILTKSRSDAEFIRHLIVGGSGVVFNWSCFNVLVLWFEFTTLPATIIVNILLLLIMFPVQNHFTFKAGAKVQRFIPFVILDIGYFSFDFLFAYLFIDVLKLHPMIGKAIGLALLTPGSFLIQKFWVFRNDNAKSGPETLEANAETPDPTHSAP